jgi:PIN domain nuclease of toxin-antitoxin system
LSVAAGDFVDKAAVAGNQIGVSSISLAEIVYLIEKHRLSANAYTDLKAALDDPDHVFKEVPFTVEIVDNMRHVPRADVPDMPDRIVAATAVHFGVPVISRDGKIRASNVQTVW